jgi:nucleoside-diphosphate-sugar epimerase
MMANKTISIKQMKYVITGGAGFIGTPLIKKLRFLGHQVYSLDIKDGYDLTKMKTISNLPEFDILIHLAGNMFVPDSFDNPEKYYFNNFVTTLNALELCRKHKAKLIYSSSYVYGIPQYLPIDEAHPTVASNPYMQTKLIGEQICEGYNRDFKVPVVILRPFNIIGPGQNVKFLIPKIIQQISTGNVTLFDSRPKRDYIYIDDVVDIFIAAAEYRKNDFEIFNIGSGKSYSVEGIVEMLRKSSEKEFTVRYMNKFRPNEILDTIADIKKAQKLLNWTPKVNLEDALKLIAIK